MRVVFILPGYPREEIGGYRTVFIHANYLVQHGYDVSIVYPFTLFWPPRTLLDRIKSACRYVKETITHKHYVRWFKLDKRVRECFVWNLDEKRIPPGDIVVATSFHTSFVVAKYQGFNPNKKFYYIQDFEAWFGVTDEMVYESYRLPLKKIVISKWLKKEVETQKETSYYIPNGLEHADFYLERAMEERDPLCVMFYWHEMERKGCKYTLEALNIVHQRYPQLKVLSFGFFSNPDFPEYIHYEQKPSRQRLREMYNGASIFTGASIEEGFGLTIGEAMCCGCAVACSDNYGFKEMAVDGETALLFPCKDSVAQANAISQLIDNMVLRKRLSMQAVTYMREFTWDKACIQFEQVIQDTNKQQ